jgi:uncharacterized phage protein (TIGR02220 family)
LKINAPTTKEILLLQEKHGIENNLLILFALGIDSGKATVVKTLMEEFDIDKDKISKFARILKDSNLITEKDIDLIQKLDRTKLIDKEDYSEEISEILKHCSQVFGHKYSDIPTRVKMIEQWLRKGYSIESFKIVNLYFAAKWGKDVTMGQYLRPETLYNTKFDTRVEEAEVEFKIILANRTHIENIYNQYSILMNEGTIQLECFDIPSDIQKAIVFWLKKGYSEQDIIIAIDETIKSWMTKAELIPYINIVKILDTKFPERAAIAVKRSKTSGITKQGILAVSQWLDEANNHKKALS